MATDADIVALADRFHSAALGSESWPNALEALAALTGSRSGQLIHIGADWTVPFNWITNVDAEQLAELEAIRGHDPSINPRVKAGSKARVFDILAESDFISPEDHKSSPIYANQFRRMDIPFICLTNLIRERDFMIGLTVNRSAREGHAGDDVRRIIQALAPHVRAAIRTQLALEGQGALLVSGALDALSVAAFILDRNGFVIARTPMTESLVSGDGPLVLKARKLRAKDAEKTRLLANAIAASALGSRPPLRSLVIARTDALRPLVLDVAPLPAPAHGFAIEAKVLVVARVPHRDHDGKHALLKTAFALTAAEAEVAIILHQGAGPRAIAIARGASENTVKAQIKAIYAKMSVANRAEFASRLIGLF